MGLSTYFHGEIRDVGMGEFAECLSALTGHYYLLQDKEGALFDPHNVIFEEKEECVSYRDSYNHIPYGQYTLVCIANPVSYQVEIEKDKCDDPKYADGLKIKLFDFIDKPYEEGDFFVVSGLCEHLGFSKYEISGDYEEKSISKSFGKASADYFRNIRNSGINRITKIVDRTIADHFCKGWQKEKPDIRGIFQLIVKKRNEELSRKYDMSKPAWKDLLVNETTYLYDKAVVSGFYECSLSLEEYKEEIKKGFYNKDAAKRIDKIFSRFEDARSEFESNLYQYPEL